MNMLADMKVQPATRQTGLVAVTASTDTLPPVSIFTFPAAGASVPIGTPVTITGTATDAGGGIVAANEVSVDGGAWTPAELAVEPSADSWRMWRLVTTLGPGAHQLRVRAKDRSGDVQTMPSAQAAASRSSCTLG